MSQFRVEKRRASAEVTLSTGGGLRGAFFLAASGVTQTHPERVADLLNGDAGFLPFAAGADGNETMLLLNRAHVIAVKLLDAVPEAQLDPGYELATERQVGLLLSDGTRLVGVVRLSLPPGRDRLSDYARTPEMFRYLETDAATFVVNTAHIVEMTELISEQR
jgi:hypothetical protein